MNQQPSGFKPKALTSRPVAQLMKTSVSRFVKSSTEGSVLNCAAGSEEKVLKIILMFRLCCSV